MLRECLLAIARQTYPHFTALVCDNAASTETAEIVQELGDTRFLYVSRPRNLGISLNALEGYRAATTPYVMEVDDDDLLYARCLEVLLLPFESHPDLVLVFAGMEAVDESGRLLPPPLQELFAHSLLPGRKQPFTELAAKGAVNMVAALLRRDAVDWYSIPMSSGPAYDRSMALAAAREGRPAYYVNQNVTAYRVHRCSDGVSNTCEQFRGAVNALEAELLRATVADRAILRRQMVRHRAILCRALLLQWRVREAFAAVAPVFRHVSTLKELIDLTVAARRAPNRSFRHYAPHHPTRPRLKRERFNVRSRRCRIE